MEPRPCGRGNVPMVSRRAPNGQLQWSHDLAVVETADSSRAARADDSASMEPRPCGRGNREGEIWDSSRCRCFNGATTLRSWKPETHRRLGETRRGFNGATTLRSWKHHGRHQRHDGRGASMEPRPCGRGNLRSGCAVPPRYELQWSHDLAVVETS